eukprot:3520531-Pleurochrysis_carterae.AAC.2
MFRLYRNLSAIVALTLMSFDLLLRCVHCSRRAPASFSLSFAGCPAGAPAGGRAAGALLRPFRSAEEG